MQLFCFSYAGGTSSFFDQLGLELSPAIETVALEYAGHGNRHKEDLYDNLSELTDDLYSRIKEAYCPNSNYALMGYSMGCISLMPIYKKLIEEKELPKPVHVFLAAHEPYTKKEFLTYKDPDAEGLVKKRVIRFGGVPERLLNNNAFWRTYLPIYKSDFYLIGTYNFEEEKPRIDVPATLFYSETDSPYKDIIEWKKYLIAGCDLFRYEGDHFFIKEHYQEMAVVIKNKLSEF